MEKSFYEILAPTRRSYAPALKRIADGTPTRSDQYPGARSNSLADQLNVVARLIAGGSKTRVYAVTLGGFDSHAEQNSGKAGCAPHGRLLGELSTAISAFQDDLALFGIEDRVIGMTFSEFGRSVRENRARGTDDGGAGPLFVFGSNVRPGLLGSNPLIDGKVPARTGVAMQFDLRSVYASVLSEWCLVPDSALRTIIPGDVKLLPIIRDAATRSTPTLGTNSGDALR
ncbi:MAG TPA: DUF1501 domain-containing protein [Candidatus Kapabacteria bacterium]|nr:DUF1501 domain-containing protein [Candidatus Kapabacteria bacterium]